MRERAKELRKAPTLSERRMWNWLRNRSFNGFKFRRQVAIGRYVLDFYCPQLKLAIELDGHQHETPWMAEYDGDRSAYLRVRGIEIVRIPNELLAKDSLMVEQIIEAAILAK
ncbi:MAG TPA: endonuclease domain-containing protein [Vicinamibacterales bacterium]|nr:endonuclease domain-containing protein [Vicinamibacterales bacterium]